MKTPWKKGLVVTAVGHESENEDFHVYAVDQQNDVYHIGRQDIPFSLHIVERNGFVQNQARGNSERSKPAMARPSSWAGF